jgi:hypothetical protein
MTAPRSLPRFVWAVLAALALACASVAAAQDTGPKTAGSGATAPAQPASASSAATVSKAARAKSATASSTRRTTASSAGAKTKSKGSTAAAAKTATPKDGASRRLTDVHIEGEMPVPQVLFITARDQRRYVDFQHQRYLRDSRALGAATATPTRVTAAGNDTPH